MYSLRFFTYKSKSYNFTSVDYFYYLFVDFPVNKTDSLMESHLLRFSNKKVGAVPEADMSNCLVTDSAGF